VPPPLGQRILRGVGANAIGQFVTVGTQLLSLPLFLHYWTLSQYGEWLIVSAIPAYFSLADVGIGTVAMNRMTMLVAQGRTHEADRAFQSALALTAGAAVTLFGISLLLIWTLELGHAGGQDTRLSLSILMAVALLGTFTPLVDGAFRAGERFATGTMAIQLIRATEWVGALLGLFIGRTMPAVAAGMLLGRLIPSIVLVFCTRVLFPHFHWSFSGASRSELGAMLPAATAFLALPVGNAILLQGTTLVVGFNFGPAAVAIFNSCRTLSRIPVQILTTFSRSIWPELSRSYGAGDMQVLTSLYRRSRGIAMIGSAIACTGLYAASPVILRVWSHSTISFDAGLVGLFCATAFAGCVWQIEQVLLSATNTHVGISTWYFLMSLAAVLLSTLVPSTAGPGLVVVCLLTFELVMFAIAHRSVARLLRSSST